ncbi:hypothetical protein MNBD_IGNAVI01-2786 [hydrothermal vent metagenome]|uniref:Uncharacterized protein n=1 Tax=hydrothermal vent metagenome TaxID=652676 RepID=A0A3B1D1F0_9ZZZZ
MSKKKSSIKSTEKLLSKITKELEKQNFKSEEELQKYLEEHFMGKEPDFNDDFVSANSDKAQDLVWDAWELEYSEDRVELALQALKLDENCADAYNLLAEDKAKNNLERLNYYLKATRAGKESIGEDFEALKGEFWGFHQTRPYMRAMDGLAHTYLHMNQIKKAIDVWQKMINLNPNDNQGVRYHLIIALLETKRYKDVERLINKYEDDASAAFLYSKAFLFFHQKSKKPMATKVLIKAMQFNPYVPLYLFGLREMPEEFPEYIGFGDESEAIEYADSSVRLWGGDKKAAAWLADIHKKNADDLDRLIIEKEKKRESR